MLVCFSLLVIFVDFLLINVECSVISQAVVKDKINKIRKIRDFGETAEEWMKDVLRINDDLLKIQAMIAKDEESTTNCMTGSRRTNKRYLMCVGSILSEQYVMTSATCIHEATYIRHNLKAPLVVVVGFLKSNPQVIRVQSYKIHPDHVVFPYNHLHTKHNIAVMKLSCRISAEHFAAIEMPKSPYTEVCSNDNCMVAVLRKVGKTSHVIYDTRAKYIPNFLRKRRSIETAPEFLQNNNTTEISLVEIQKDLKETSKTPLNTTQGSMNYSESEKLISPKSEKIIQKSESQNEGDSKIDLSKSKESNPEDIPFEKLAMFVSGKEKSQDVFSEKLGSFFSRKQTNSSFSTGSNAPISMEMKGLQSLGVISTTPSIADQYVFQGGSDRNDKLRSFSVRASDGFQGCPQSGSPVTYDRVQAALVSISCDDRQPGTAWEYTDVFINVGWIQEIMRNWSNDTNKMNTGSSNNGTGCSTCIYNFFIDLTGPSDKINCTQLDIQDENSPNYKLCVSHAKQKKDNIQRSIPQQDVSKYNSYRNLTKSHNQKRSRKHNNRKKMRDETTESKNRERIPKFDKDTLGVPKSNSQINFENRKLFRKYRIKDEKVTDRNVDTLMLKNITQDSSKKLGKDEGRNNNTDSNGVLRMDFDQNFNIDFDKKLQSEFQKNFNKDFRRNFSKLHDGNVERRLQKHYFAKNMELQNGNRLRKQIGAGDYRGLHTAYKPKKMEPQQNIEYNPMANKLHKLRLVLARIQKSVPGKDADDKEYSNLGHGMKHFKEGRIPPNMDRQYAVLFQDREMQVAKNHHNVYPGFNG